MNKERFAAKPLVIGATFSYKITGTTRGCLENLWKGAFKHE